MQRVDENSYPVKRPKSQATPPLSEHWAKFLDNPAFDWALYGHFTFRDVVSQYDGLKRHVHPESADKSWMRFIHNLNRSIFGVRYTGRPGDGVSWARATELQTREAIHYHAVIGRVPGEIRRLDLMDEWNRSCGFARIYAYEAGKGAEYYLSKSCYAWKHGEIDLGGPLAYLLRNPGVGRPSLVS